MGAIFDGPGRSEASISITDCKHGTGSRTGGQGNIIVMQISLSLRFTVPGSSSELLLIKIGEWQTYGGDGDTDTHYATCTDGKSLHSLVDTELYILHTSNFDT